MTQGTKENDHCEILHESVDKTMPYVCWLVDIGRQHEPGIQSQCQDMKLQRAPTKDHATLQQHDKTLKWVGTRSASTSVAVSSSAQAPDAVSLTPADSDEAEAERKFSS